MKIISIELFGYKRMSLKLIQKIKIDFTEQLQLILGTNGSGKSSLIKELTPLPANAANYTKDGYKIITLENGNDQFKLSSMFSPTQRHSFLKNDEELNPGGTSTVQRELVKKEFNITPEVHDLISGLLFFNTMGPGERRSWFTKLSDVNFTYAIQVYQKLKEKQRDVSGALKLSHGRLVQETGKLISEEQELKLKNEIKDLKTYISFLIEQKSIQNRYPDDLTKENEKIEFNLKQSAKQLLTWCFNCFKYLDKYNLNNIDQNIVQVQTTINSQEFVIKHVYEEIEKHQQTVNALTLNNLDQTEDIDRKIKEIKTSIETTKLSLKDYLDFEDPLIAFQALDTIQDIVSDITTMIPSNEEKKFSRDSYQSLVLQKQTVLNEVKACEIELNKLSLQLKAMEEDLSEHPINCPNCNHQWHRVYSAEKHQLLIKKINDLNSYLGDKKAIETKLESLIQEMNEYMTLFRSYNDITRSWPILKPLWDHILSSDLIFKNPRQINTLIQKVKHDLKVAFNLKNLESELKNLDELKCLIEKNGSNNLKDLQTILDRLNLKYFEENEKFNLAKQELVTLNNLKVILNDINSVTTFIQQSLDSFTGNTNELIESLKQQTINKIIHFVQFELSAKEHSVSQIEIQKMLVQDIQNQIIKLEEENVVLKLLVKELSPTEGLIAKGLLGFINNFVKQMNSFIRKVWLYPMEIIPCLPDENNEVDLDYKFGVLINQNIPIPDIKDTSSAQAEIINLAFRIVAIKYLGLSNGSLVLDEFAKNLDHAHRQSAFNVIASLMTQSDFKQIFIVSHYADCYGSLKNAEVTVLCNQNIVLPKDTVFNLHVTIN